MKKFILITGAKGGLGTKLVSEFISTGYIVIGTDIFEDNKSVSCNSFHYIKMNFNDYLSSDDISNKFYDSVCNIIGDGQLVGIINNAATQILNDGLNLNKIDLEKSLDINVVMPFLLVKQFFYLLASSRGTVINIGSIHAKLTKPKFIAYATSKAAISGMTKAMAVEFGGQVTINAIQPAAIETQMLLDSFSNDGKKLEELKKFHPTKKIGNLVELSRLCQLLISGDFRFLNGAVIEYDGGISSRLHDPD